MIKTIYAQAPKTGLSRIEFVHRWREHGALAMRLPAFWNPVVRYMQSDRLNDVTAFRGADASYVGVGELQYADHAGRQESKRAPDLTEILHPDASSIFDRDSSVNLGVEEVFLVKGRYAPIKIYHFLARPDGSERGDFIRRWEAAQAKLLGEMSTGSVRRVVSGRAFEDASEIDATLEFSFDTIEDAARFHREWLERLGDEDVASKRLKRHLVIPAFVSLFYDRCLYP